MDTSIILHQSLQEKLKLKTFEIWRNFIQTAPYFRERFFACSHHYKKVSFLLDVLWKVMDFADAFLQPKDGLLKMIYLKQ